MINAMNSLLNLRAALNRIIYPRSGYFMPVRSVGPISEKQGFDRGTPIDRYFIDKFIGENRVYIRGVCLEVGDRRYTEKFGSGVMRSDILDVDTKNSRANVLGDLSDLKNVANGSYDCVIVTQVIGMIPEAQKTFAEIYRILKENGTLLFVGSYFSRTMNPEKSYWRFTAQGCRYELEKHFDPKLVEVVSFGNCLVGQYFWVGASVEDLDEKELLFNDPRYPVTIGARAIK